MKLDGDVPDAVQLDGHLDAARSRVEALGLGELVVEVRVFGETFGCILHEVLGVDALYPTGGMGGEAPPTIF